LVGVNSVLGRLSGDGTGEPAEARVHISARFADAAEAQIIEDEVYALSLSGPAGACSFRSETRPRLEIVNGFVARELVTTQLEWCGP